MDITTNFWSFRCPWLKIALIFDGHEMVLRILRRFGLEAGLHAIPLTPLGHRNRRQRGLAVVLLLRHPVMQ